METFIFLTTIFADVANSSSSDQAAGLATGLIFILLSFMWLIPVLIWLFAMVLMLAGLVFWILMLIDLVKRDFEKQDEKILWLLIVLLTHFVGAIIYYFVVVRASQSKSDLIIEKNKHGKK